MAPVSQRDAQALHQALATGGDDISVSLSRETVAFLSQIVDAQASGHEIVFSRVPEEVSPAEAAQMLGMSRPHVRKLMNQGVLPFRMVGSHHRIPVADFKRFQEVERNRRHQALADLLELENELGLNE
ncbi:MAG: helix-turn-helix domain-containing protein [Propionibacteriaceae bacterium]|jgi:excisionase family DNA binding protein|nr:helix-turn-helix domain-containing protein [Propionibacteriaceae bacterium]